MKSNAMAVHLISFTVMASALGIISTPAATGSVFTVDATFADNGTLVGSFNPTSPYTGTSLTFTDPSLDCTPCTPMTLTGLDASDIYFAGCVLGAADFCYVSFNEDFSIVSPGGTDPISFADDFEISYATLCESNCSATLQSSAPEPSSATMILLGCAGIFRFVNFRDLVKRRLVAPDGPDLAYGLPTASSCPSKTRDHV